MKTRQSLSCKFHNYRNEKYTSVQVCPTFLPHIYFTRHIFLRRVTARWSRGLAKIKCGPVKSRKFVISNCMYQKLRDPSKIVIIKSENSSVNWLKSLWASFTWKPSLDWKKSHILLNLSKMFNQSTWEKSNANKQENQGDFHIILTKNKRILHAFKMRPCC